MTYLMSKRLIKNGIAALLIALLGGFALMFSMLHGISLSPAPLFIPYEMPGTPQGWRAFHLGMVTNGIMAITLGVVMRSLSLTPRAAVIAAWGTIVAIWGNCVFYLFTMFAPNHGLTLGANALGNANVAGLIAFFPAFIGALSLILALVVLLRADFTD